jgi:LuxR family maltose regulon positive regulatory protein
MAEYLGRVLPAPLGEPAVDLLEQHTEGWIAVLHLVSLSLRSMQEPETVLESLSGVDNDIADYLVDEVLSRQPPKIQKFLLRTSILDRFCAPLCEAVAGSRDPECNAR